MKWIAPQQCQSRSQWMQIFRQQHSAQYQVSWQDEQAYQCPHYPSHQDGHAPSLLRFPQNAHRHLQYQWMCETVSQFAGILQLLLVVTFHHHLHGHSQRYGKT